MIIAMFLAHLVGDFILQWDALARWKSQSMQGVMVHSLVLAAVTAAFALPFRPFWWQGVLFISVTHFLIDAAQFYYRPSIPPLLRFFIDQFLHLLMILIALAAGAYLSWPTLWPDIVAAAEQTPMLTALLGYAFITMPAWVLIKFAVYGLVKRQPPDFPAGPNKYVGIVERLLITTMVIFGQVLIVPLIALPRLIIDWPKVNQTGADSIYLTEYIASIALAVIVGVGLRLFAF